MYTLVLRAYARCRGAYAAIFKLLAGVTAGGPNQADVSGGGTLLQYLLVTLPAATFSTLPPSPVRTPLTIPPATSRLPPLARTLPAYVPLLPIFFLCARLLALDACARHSLPGAAAALVWRATAAKRAHLAFLVLCFAFAFFSLIC